jgi:hypothetical protein
MRRALSNCKGNNKTSIIDLSDCAQDSLLFPMLIPSKRINENKVYFSETIKLVRYKFHHAGMNWQKPYIPKPNINRRLMRLKTDCKFAGLFTNSRIKTMLSGVSYSH